mmetsp:Transcript_28898/g.40683  ORF Transcript_28898/g.40683 Transcript_28898/m.40683 type:complete len:524 (+) Transcript_28898:27-1598(+)
MEGTVPSMFPSVDFEEVSVESSRAYKTTLEESASFSTSLPSDPEAVQIQNANISNDDDEEELQPTAPKRQPSQLKHASVINTNPVPPAKRTSEIMKMVRKGNTIFYVKGPKEIALNIAERNTPDFSEYIELKKEIIKVRSQIYNTILANTEELHEESPIVQNLKSLEAKAYEIQAKTSHTVVLKHNTIPTNQESGPELNYFLAKVCKRVPVPTAFRITPAGNLVFIFVCDRKLPGCSHPTSFLGFNVDFGEKKGIWSQIALTAGAAIYNFCKMRNVDVKKCLETVKKMASLEPGWLEALQTNPVLSSEEYDHLFEQLLAVGFLKNFIYDAEYATWLCHKCGEATILNNDHRIKDAIIKEDIDLLSHFETSIPERTFADGSSLLHYAIKFDRIKVIDFLLKKGCDINAMNKLNVLAVDANKETKPYTYVLENLPQEPKWVKDEAFLTCQVCEAEFSFLNRRHHCRYCGKLVCKDCSNKMALIKFKSSARTKQFPGPVRVCEVCIAILEGQENIKVVGNEVPFCM